MREDLAFTLDEENEKKLYEIMYSMDVKNTPRFWIKDKRGYSAFYEKVIHCKDCRFMSNEIDQRDGSDVFVCNFNRWRRMEGKRRDDFYCADGERKEE